MITHIVINLQHPTVNPSKLPRGVTKNPANPLGRSRPSSVVGGKGCFVCVVLVKFSLSTAWELLTDICNLG
jgi:hypothetical protein